MCTDFNPRTPCGVRHKAGKLLAVVPDFNPRTPCGVRHRFCRKCGVRISFQSTHPLRGATVHRQGDARKCTFQSTHPLRGATYLPTCPDASRSISIHAPLAGCDTCPPDAARPWLSFQSTHPLRGATAKTYKENCTFFELADKLSARIAAKKPSAKADRCA